MGVTETQLFANGQMLVLICICLIATGPSFESIYV